MDELRPPSPSQPLRRGRWFHEFEVGQVFRSAARTVTEADVVGFAGLTGDFNPLHLDATFAARSGFRQRVAHGLLVEALSLGLASQTGIFDGTIAALAGTEKRFLKPVFFGDTIHVRLEVDFVDGAPRPRRGRVGLKTETYNQDSEVVAEGRWETVILQKKRVRSEARS